MLFDFITINLRTTPSTFSTSQWGWRRWRFWSGWFWKWVRLSSLVNQLRFQWRLIWCKIVQKTGSTLIWIFIFAPKNFIIFMFEAGQKITLCLDWFSISFSIFLNFHSIDRLDWYLISGAYQMTVLGRDSLRQISFVFLILPGAPSPCLPVVCPVIDAGWITVWLVDYWKTCECCLPIHLPLTDTT